MKGAIPDVQKLVEENLGTGKALLEENHDKDQSHKILKKKAFQIQHKPIYHQLDN